MEVLNCTIEKRLVTSKEDVDLMFMALDGAKTFALDLETTGLDPFTCKIVGVALAWGDPNGVIFSYYVPFMHKRVEVTPAPVEVYKVNNPKIGAVKGQPKPIQPPPTIEYFDAPELNANKEYVLHELQALLSHEKYECILHNSKFDLNVLKANSVVSRCIVQDTLVMAYVWDVLDQHGLKKQVKAIFDYEMAEFKSVVGNKSVTFDKVPVDKAVDYACDDSAYTLLLCHYYANKFDDRLWNLYQTDMQLLSVVTDMEYTGVKIDRAALQPIADELHPVLDGIKEDIGNMVGKDFNPNSGPQLCKLLFEDSGIKSISKTPNGNPSTKSDALELIKHEHPVVPLILELRTLEKLLGTYIDKLPQLVNPVTGRVHTSFNITATATRRFSSSSPNLQNIPIRTDQYALVRKAFIAEDGCLLVGADYSQIELRILAEVSGDENLLQAYIDDRDLHAHTASLMFKVDIEDVTDEQRRKAKSINFGIVYGKTVFGLSRDFGCTLQEAQNFLDMYFEAYPRVRDYIAKVQSFAYRNGYVSTLMGGRRPLNFSGTDAEIRRREREATNTSIQGSAADVIRWAMIRVHEMFVERGLYPECQLILQVHDELIVEAKKYRADEAARVMKLAMELNQPFSVPLKVEPKIGRSWYDIK